MSANHFPLYLFFERLNRAGMPVSLRDYRRISRVLAADGEWTLPRLERVLGNLLVHERDERLLFQHEFRAFFAAPAGESVAVDVQQNSEFARGTVQCPIQGVNTGLLCGAAMLRFLMFLHLR